MSNSGKILLMAGGTGGHIFPALAVAQYLSDLGWKTHWLGSENGMEVTLVPKYNIEMSLLDIRGVRGKGLLSRLLSPLLIVRAVWQSIKVLKQFKPNVVLGMGGFASGPGGIAAWLMRIPLCIHEQNAVAGVTNRILSKFARYRLQAFPNAMTVSDAVTGNPIRASISNLESPERRFAEHQGAIKLLIIGGSRGAAIFNQIMPEVMPLLGNDTNFNVWHQTGKGNRGLVLQRYQDVDTNTELLKIDEFITEMDDAYQWADIVLCRSGALTVSELAAAGLGAIFVPFPHAVDDHQTANGQYLTQADAAVIIQQKDLNAENLAETLNGFNDRDRCLKLAMNAKKQSKPEATKDVADYCIRAANLNSARYAA